MLRVKDAEKSIQFYKDVMGMKLKRTSENKDAGFNLYFLGYGGAEGDKQADQEGLLELTVRQTSFTTHSGNS